MARVLYALRGVPASGKSTWIKENNLQDLTVSVDKIRQLYAQPEYEYTEDTAHKEHYNYRIEEHVWDTMWQVVEFRLSKGYTTFIDFTNLSKKSAHNKLIDLAKHYGYRLTTITFGNKLSLETLKERNSKREGVAKVPDKIIEKFYNRMHDGNHEVPNRANPINVEDIDMSTFFDWRTLDLSETHYEHVVVIGDIHGCYEPLETILPLEEDTLYVFLGDLFDRGVQNNKVARLMYKLVTLPNVVLLEGNHEERLVQYVATGKLQGRDFYKTIDDIGPDAEKIFKRLINHMQPLLILNNGGMEFYITHAGTTLLPSSKHSTNSISFDINGKTVFTATSSMRHALLEPETLFTRDNNSYSYDVDEDIANHYSNIPVIQIHGHRNNYMHKPLDLLNSINLEQQVEFGGKLGMIRMNVVADSQDLEIEDISVDNIVFNNDYQVRDTTSEPAEFQRALKQSPYIRAKEMGHGLTAYNFTKDAFRNGIWNEHTTQARGLFIDRTDHIAGRGFKKFFMLNDNPEYTTEKVYQQLPMKQKDGTDSNIVIQRKYDGFLLIVSYLEQSKEILMSTKGGVTSGAMIDIAKKAFKKQGNFNEVETYLEKHPNESMLFEVVDPEHDPHLMLDKSGVYLLDVVNNTIDGDSVYKSKYDNLYEVTGVHVTAPRAPLETFLDEYELSYEGFLNDLEGSHDGIEGWVVTNLDTNFKVKIKTLEFKTRKTLRNWYNASLHSNSWQDELAMIREKRGSQEYLQPYIDMIDFYIGQINDDNLVLYNDDLFADGRSSINIPLTFDKLVLVENV